MRSFDPSFRMGAWCLAVLLTMGSAASALAAEPRIPLPPPDRNGGMSLTQSIQLRRSLRHYDGRSLSRAQIGQILWAGQGITDSAKHRRSAPSAGAMYPLELYVALKDGCFHYLPEIQALEPIAESDLRSQLWTAGLRQRSLQEAAAIFVVMGVVQRTRTKYGAMAEQYVAQESGHCAENMVLQATALGLGAVTLGGFDDAATRRVLHLDPSYTTYYLIPMGFPATH